MNKARLEAFSDGVLAIIITIMVLAIRIPQSAEWGALKPLLPIFLSYILSFLFVGIYWGNHHHLLQTLKTVNSGILMANLNLLFWLSLLPLATGWMGENTFAPNTIVLYAIISLLTGIAYGILQQQILKITPPDAPVRIAIRKQNLKVIISALACLLAIPMAFVHPVISGILFFVQSSIWLIPDRNLERAL
ncbi:TMEM175 family protein [Spirosoma areae]